MPGKNNTRINKKKKQGGSAKKDIPFATEDQHYALVVKNRGDCRMDVRNEEGQSWLGSVRGRMRNKIYVRVGDLVLISERDFETGKVDILHKYRETDVPDLRAAGGLTEKMADLFYSQNGAGSAATAATDLDGKKDVLDRVFVEDEEKEKVVSSEEPVEGHGKDDSRAKADILNQLLEDL